MKPPNRIRPAALSFAFCAALSVVAFAQTNKPKERLKDTLRLTSVKVDLDLKEASLRDSLQSLFARASVNYIHVLEVASRGKITMGLKNVPFEGALVSIIRSVENYPMTYDGEAGIVTVRAAASGDPGNMRVWLDVEKSDVRYVIKSFMRAAGANYTLEQAVQGSITLKLDGVPFQAGLDRVMKQNDPPLLTIVDNEGVIQFKIAER